MGMGKKRAEREIGRIRERKRGIEIKGGR